MGTCGCVGPWQGEGPSLQPASQKEPSPSPLPSAGKACPWGRGSCSSRQTALGCCNTRPASPQSLLHHPLAHRHLVPATNLSLGRAQLIPAVTCCCNRLSVPSFLPAGRSQSPSRQWACSCSGVISDALPSNSCALLKLQPRHIKEHEHLSEAESINAVDGRGEVWLQPRLRWKPGTFLARRHGLSSAIGRELQPWGGRGHWREGSVSPWSRGAMPPW